jgi:hypothetical protein
LLDLAYPVDDLLLSIRDQEDEGSDITSNVFLERPEQSSRKRWKLPKPRKVYLAVHRQEMIVYFKRLEPEAFALARSLQQGKPLSQAIEDSVNWSNKRPQQIMEKVHGWFANWASLGWFCAPPQEKRASQ